MAREFYEGGPIGQMMTDQDLIDSMLYGKPTPDESNAYHEAGHAVAAITFNINFNYVSLIPDAQHSGGLVLEEVLPQIKNGFDGSKPNDRRRVEECIVVTLAGEASEALYCEREFDIHRTGASGDLNAASKLVGLLAVDQSEQAEILAEMQNRARRFVRERLLERQISMVAQHLRVVRVLDRTRVIELMAEMASAFSSNSPDNENQDQGEGKDSEWN